EPRPDSHGVQERRSSGRALGSSLTAIARQLSRPGAGPPRYPAVPFLESSSGFSGVGAGFAGDDDGGNWGDRRDPPNVLNTVRCARWDPGSTVAPRPEGTPARRRGGSTAACPEYR